MMFTPRWRFAISSSARAGLTCVLAFGMFAHVASADPPQLSEPCITDPDEQFNNLVGIQPYLNLKVELGNNARKDGLSETKIIAEVFGGIAKHKVKNWRICMGGTPDSCPQLYVYAEYVKGHCAQGCCLYLVTGRIEVRQWAKLHLDKQTEPKCVLCPIWKQHICQSKGRCFPGDAISEIIRCSLDQLAEDIKKAEQIKKAQKAMEKAERIKEAQEAKDKADKVFAKAEEEIVARKKDLEKANEALKAARNDKAKKEAAAEKQRANNALNSAQANWKKAKEAKERAEDKLKKAKEG